MFPVSGRGHRRDRIFRLTMLTSSGSFPVNDPSGCKKTNKSIVPKNCAHPIACVYPVGYTPNVLPQFCSSHCMCSPHHIQHSPSYVHCKWLPPQYVIWVKICFTRSIPPLPSISHVYCYIVSETTIYYIVYNIMRTRLEHSHTTIPAYVLFIRAHLYTHLHVTFKT